MGEANQLGEAVENMHGGSAMLTQTVPVRETFEGKTVWEGVVHVFDLAGHPTATRAYAWSSPIEGSAKRRFFGRATSIASGQPGSRGAGGDHRRKAERSMNDPAPPTPKALRKLRR